MLGVGLYMLASMLGVGLYRLASMLGVGLYRLASMLGPYSSAGNGMGISICSLTLSIS